MTTFVFLITLSLVVFLRPSQGTINPCPKEEEKGLFYMQFKSPKFWVRKKEKERRSLRH